MTTCEVPDCDVERYHRQPYCRRHWHRWRRNGDALGGRHGPSHGAACSVDDCARPGNGGRGYCGLHYQRWRKTGDATAVLRPGLEERLWSRIDRRGPDECWPWTGNSNEDGYGIVVERGQRTRAHRALYVRLNGVIDDDVEVRHTCDWPPCCNPAHLVPGDHSQNMDDMVARGRRARRWTDDQLEAVRTDPRSCTVVAAEYGMSKSYVLVLRKQYRKGMHRSFSV